MTRTVTRSAAAWCGALALLSTPLDARADTVTDWNQIALRATGIAAVSVPVQTRAMAMVHSAIFDAVNAVERKYAVYAIDIRAASGARPDAATAAAAHGILERLYPQQKPILDAALAASLARLRDDQARADGVKLGQDVAEKLFALRKDDGSAAQVSHTFSTGPGAYQPTPPTNASPILPQWRKVAPFLVKPLTPSGIEQFTFTGPPALPSPEFARDLNEVKRLGSRTSTERTNEQTAIAIHWAGSEVPPINAVARAAAAAKGLNLVDTARLFALLNMTMADSLIVGFEAKYAFNFWRPVTAIRNAGLASNPAISADPGWEPLIVSPPHQEYPSAHSLGAGAAVAVLQDVFGSDKLSTSYVYPPLGVVRRWESFSEIATEVANARVWGGIHYRTSVEHGTQIGRQIAEYALKTSMPPVTH